MRGADLGSLVRLSKCLGDRIVQKRKRERRRAYFEAPRATGSCCTCSRTFGDDDVGGRVWVFQVSLVEALDKGNLARGQRKAKVHSGHSGPWRQRGVVSWRSLVAKGRCVTARSGPRAPRSGLHRACRLPRGR